MKEANIDPDVVVCYWAVLVGSRRGYRNAGLQSVARSLGQQGVKPSVVSRESQTAECHEGSAIVRADKAAC